MAAQNSVLVHIAQPYAQALFDLGQEAGELDAIEKDLGGLMDVVGKSADFARFLRSPVIASDTKAATMETILAKAGLSPTVSNFIRLVARNGRLFALPTIIESFRQMAAAARGEMMAEVTSATPLKPDQVRSLAQTLKAKVGKTVRLTEHVDPSLIGGLVVKVGSQMIDSSLKTKLTAMKIAMKEVR